jgi:large repetitive protein
MVRRLRAVVGPAVLVPALACTSPAAADTPFKARFSANANGDVAVVGNTLETCQSSVGGCDAARAGSGSTLNNNGFTMERVDVDSDAATFNSSSAHLILPPGARVLFAGLYYGSRTSAGTRGKAAPEATPSALGTVDLRPPGRTAYERLRGTLDESSTVTGAYGVFVDVTRQVREAGSGSYTVADVQSATGEDRYSGWALVVAYEASGDPPRNLTVFDGLQAVTQGKPALTIPVSGFQTPLSGAVRTKLGFVAYEGDLGLGGDSAALDGKALTDAVNPATNFFDSEISIDGGRFTAKNPNYANQQGFDAKLVRINGVLGNGATRADIALKTSSDQYLPHVITFATDLYAPVIRATKTVLNLTHPGGPARPGDALRYTITYANHGLEAATGFVAQDELPTGITYLPGSISTATGPVSDIAGDDAGEYDAAARAVRVSLGTLAVSGAAGDTAEISFEARVNPDSGEQREITDVAQAKFIAPTLGKELSAVSSPANVTVIPEPTRPIADIATTQTETVAPDPTGDKVDDQILIINHGPDDATDVLMREKLPAGAVVDNVTIDQGSCTVTASEVTCKVPHLDDGGAVDVNLVEQVPAGTGAAGSTNEATATAAQLDPKPGDNSDEAMAMPASRATPADLVIDTTESKRSVPLGGMVDETIAVHNDGPGTATGVDVTEVLGAAAQLESVAAGSATCAAREPLHCTIASLPAGATLRIVLVVRPLRPGPLLDAVSVSGGEVDSSYANNVAKAVASVRSRSTVARVGVDALRSAVKPGQRVGFVLTASVVKVTPGLAPLLCATLPAGLRLRAAPGSSRHGATVCWRLRELVRGSPQRFRVSAAVRLGFSAASLQLRARLTGSNFTPRAAAAAVAVPPVVPVACGSSAGPRARIAC